MKKSKFQIIQQRLVRSDFRINKSFKQKKGERFNIEFTPNIKVMKFKEKNEALVSFSLEVFKDEDSSKYPFYIILTIDGLFKWSDGLENVDNYLNVNAPAVLMSYMRSIVSQLTVFAGYPPLVLPLINFTENLNKSDKK